MDTKEKPHYVGHRERLREKLLVRGENSLADYELLELILMMALPRIDVKPLAKTLLTRFKNFAGVLRIARRINDRQRHQGNNGCNNQNHSRRLHAVDKSRNFGYARI